MNKDKGKDFRFEDIYNPIVDSPENIENPNIKILNEVTSKKSEYFISCSNICKRFFKFCCCFFLYD